MIQILFNPSLKFLICLWISLKGKFKWMLYFLKGFGFQRSCQCWLLAFIFSLAWAAWFLFASRLPTFTSSRASDSCKMPVKGVSSPRLGPIPSKSNPSLPFADPLHLPRQLPGLQVPDCGQILGRRRQGRRELCVWRDQQVRRVLGQVPLWQGNYLDTL